MPSEDAKAVKKEEMKKEDEGEENSLSAILEARRNNRTNAGTLIAKSQSKVKKEEPQDGSDDDFDKPIKGKGSQGSRSRAAKVKKEENGDADDDDNKPISKKRSASKADKELSNKKKKVEEVKKKATTTTDNNVTKKEKKVYDLPGQKRDPPEERDPLRIFYETLYKQVPNSEMAQIWMMESGLLPKEEAKKVYEKKQKKTQQKLNSPMKTATATKTQSTSAKKKTPSSPLVSAAREKAMDSKAPLKQSKKRKAEEGSDGNGSDEDFLIYTTAKKQRALN